MDLLGYADTFSLAPGERIRFMVSARVPSYEASIVRFPQVDQRPNSPGFTGEVVDTPVTGRYSVGASGRAIRERELAEPLREFTIASDLVSMLGAVRAAGAEPRWVPFGGSVSTPPLLIGAMAVSGS